MAEIDPHPPARVCGLPHALVTDASAGIGRATAIRLAVMGYHVHAAVGRERDVDELWAEGIHYLAPVLFDVSRTDQLEALAQRLAAHTSGLEVLVDSTGPGMAVPRGKFTENVTRAVLPLIRARGGTIVMIGSGAGLTTSPFGRAQTSARWAARSGADALRRELTPWGIRVVLVEPATIASETAGTPPAIVASAVTTALRAKRPRARYSAGRQARVLASIARLPALVQDRLLVRLLGV